MSQYERRESAGFSQRKARSKGKGGPHEKAVQCWRSLTAVSIDIPFVLFTSYTATFIVPLTAAEVSTIDCELKYISEHGNGAMKSLSNPGWATGKKAL